MSDTPITDEMAEKHPSWPNTAVHFACKLERELAVANRIIKECLSVMPVGYIPSHTPENLPAKIEELVKELAENTTIRHERIAEELAEVTKQRDAFRDELSKVMPPDYKDWWQNDKNEWPLIARLIIESKRRLIDMDRETIERLERELAEITKQRDELAKALRSLIRLDDQFNDPEYCESGTHEGAYLCFYKGEFQTWENARKALAAVKGGKL